MTMARLFGFYEYLFVLNLQSLLDCAQETTEQRNILIEGIGAGLPYHLYREFMYSYEEAHPGVAIEYELTDSWNGICIITRECLEKGRRPYLFSASSLQIPDDVQERYPELVEFPTMAGGIVVTYNLPGIDLKLTMAILSGIYSGRVTRWTDPLILASNPDIQFPNVSIDVVARVDISSNTKILTKIFNNEDSSWAANFGIFHDSNWNSSTAYGDNWPPSVIKYFAVQSIGMVGIIKSFANTIGYASLADAAEHHLQIAGLYNPRGNLIGLDGIAKGIESAMDYFVANNYEGLTPELSDANSPDAYPLGILSYMIINITTSPEIGCAEMLEFVHFIEQTIVSQHNRAEARKVSMIPLTEAMANQVRNKVLKKATCQGQNVYEMYMKQIADSNKMEQATQRIIAVLAALTGITIIAMIGAFIMLNRRARNRILDAEKLVWEWSDFIAIRTYARINSASTVGRKENTNTSSNAQSVIFDLSTSGTRPSTGISEAIADETAGERSQLFGRTEDTSVFLFKLPGGLNVYNLSRESRRQLLELKEIGNREIVMRLLGVAMLDKADNSFTVFSGEATWKWLNTVLKKSKYEINDDVRIVLAKDIASGMQYLHSKGITHGMLSSVSCFLDTRWTIKISDWSGRAIFEHIYGPRAWPAHVRAKFEKYVAQIDDDISHEDDVAMQYIDPTIITQSESQILTEKTFLINCASDVYSYGLLLFELWTQKEPFPRKKVAPVEKSGNDDVKSNNNNLSNSHINNARRKPRETMASILVKRINPSVPSALPNGVTKIAQYCLDANSDQRPPFAKIITLLAKLGGTKTANIVETLMQSMEEYMQGLHEKVEERTAHLQETTDKMDLLLSSMLPREIITKLQSGTVIVPEYYDSATVYFSDIVGFTKISATSTPLEIVTMLNSLYSLFDGTIERFDVYKVETIGDSYMCVSGVPQRNGMNHIKEIAEMSLLIISNIKIYKIPHIPHQSLQIRVGINSGPLMAGVVGLKMPRYCLFGDTVNTASRMESTSAPMRIQATAATAHDLQRYFPGKFRCAQRGKVEIKGKGFMETYWIQPLSRSSDLLSISDSDLGEGPSGYDPQVQNIPMYKAIV